MYCGLSSGDIRCYNYQEDPRSGPSCQLSSHSGPVLALACHTKHFLLASGGADTEVVLWDTATNQRRLRLRGHTDYVRALVWHPLYSWLISASDDGSVRIWNWLSRSLLSTVSGHQHWVTSLALHQSRDILVSASLDGSVRVWDFSQLRNRTCRAGAHTEVSTLLGLLDVVCQKVLEDFSSRVEFVVLHPTQEVLAVGEGRHVTLYSLDTFRQQGRLVGHRDRVTGGLWRLEAQSGTFQTFLTVGRDQTARLWTFQSGVCRRSLQTDLKYEGLADTVRHSYLAAWAEDRLEVFKVSSERPVMTSHGQHLYFLKNGSVRHYNAGQDRERVLLTVSLPRDHQLTSLQYNSTEHSLLLNSTNSRAGRSVYQLYPIIDGVSNGKLKVTPSQGSCSVWTAHNRFVHLDDKHQIIVKNLENKNVNFGGLTAGFLLPKTETGGANAYKQPTCDRVLPGGRSHSVLLQAGDSLTLYDVVKKRRLASAQFPGVKRLLWTEDRSLVALCSRREIFLCDGGLKVLTRTKPRYRVKSVSWYEGGNILLYSTENQVRYLLPAGYEGPVLSTKELLYLGLCRDQSLVCLTRRQQLRKIQINPAEFLFKSAVIEGNQGEILR